MRDAVQLDVNAPEVASRVLDLCVEFGGLRNQGDGLDYPPLLSVRWRRRIRSRTSGFEYCPLKAAQASKRRLV